jgi:2-polyprenyl-3-methyl-5-hydroxy-6-metoxy-1,4-benzoquinol methylase
MGCCNARGCDKFFGPRIARHMAKRYQKRGPDKTARRMVAFLDRHGIEGASVLEIGGGIGEIQIELLKLGAARAVNLELSPSYEEEAAKLLGQAGLEGWVERRLHDIAAEEDGVARADVVVLNRVVCCYPDYKRLLRAAADHAQRVVVFSYPRANVISRFAVATQNLVFKLRRSEFRTYIHPPDAMLDVLGDRGLRLTFAHHALVWQTAALER